MSYEPSGRERIVKMLPIRPSNSNKGTFGQVAVVGGSVGMSGAGFFAAKAAYRSGCGLVRLISPEENRIIYQTQLPEAVLTLYDGGSPDESVIKNAVCRATSVVLGVGLGRSAAAKSAVKYTLEAVNCPIVIDADGLNIISEDPELWRLVPENAIVTPHPAEMSRLSGIPIPDIIADIPGTAERFAREHRVVCVMKDAHTAVSDGSKTSINTTGNNGMSTGGAGDVLTGIISALLAQGLAPYDAAVAGVYIHGLAGDIAAKRLSEYSLIASDIIDSLPSAFSGLKG